MLLAARGRGSHHPNRPSPARRAPCSGGADNRPLRAARAFLRCS
jgi:hypothetical protein